MQLGPLLESLELRRSIEVPLHHIEEAIVVLGRTSGVLDQQSTCFSQTPAHLAAQLLHFALRSQVQAQIYHRQLHFPDPNLQAGSKFNERFLVFEGLQMI